jgi:UDPglucose 6-dehydrogenase
MLATRISFMNELANLAEQLGADIEQVRLGIGSDSRIGYPFLYAGAGFGGSCFPKDIVALRRTARDHGVDLPILGAVHAVNEAQKRRLPEKVVARFGPDLAGRRFALWGLAFKPNTDDMREAPSQALVRELVGRGAQICAYDPAAEANARRVFRGLKGVSYVTSPLAALEKADALVVVTEWKEFRSPDFEEIRARLREPVIFDGRNMYDPAYLKTMGIEYHAIGRSNAR